MSEVKVNKISPRTNCGTVTLGDSGDTFTIPSGVTITNNGTQTGFGREGSVNWQTSIKTATFTAASGEGYFCNTSGGAFTVNLPSSPSVGDIVAIKDYGSSFATNNLTIGRGGSNMNGSASDSVRDTQNESLTLVYADATKGWLSVEEGTGFIGENFVSATGGTITTSGNCKIHTFTGPGTFTVCSTATCAANNVVSYVVVAGGGGGGKNAGGGGGAGGYREVKSPVTPFTASPLDGYPSSPNRITVTATAFPITVGSGGSGSTSAPSTGGSGSASTFSTISSAGGGGGGSDSPSSKGGVSGGSGGGARANSNVVGGTGNTPPTTPSQGFPGGNTALPPYPGCNAGGGGGATQAGFAGNSSTPSANQGDGGAGATSCITGSPVARAGGGGGPNNNPGPAGDGGAGGGGDGGGCGQTATAGTANTGGGGGGGQPCGNNGGSGIVIIRYKFQ
jgi:hypothetical protein